MFRIVKKQKKPCNSLSHTAFPDNIYFISMSFLLTLLDLLEVSVLDIVSTIGL